MLNKEDILALAWEHSEGSGKRYIFTEESLFAFLKELDKEPPPAQDEREAHVPDKVFQDEFQVWWEDHGQFCRAGGGDYERTFAFQAWRHLYPMLLQARATRPAQTEQQPEQSGLVEALEEIASGLQAEFAWEVAEQALAAYRAMLAAQETNKI